MFRLWNSRVDALVRAAASVGMNYFAYAPARTFFHRRPVDSGLLILSRFPVEATEFVMFSMGSGADAYAAKGVLYAHVRLAEDFCLHLFTTHLDAGEHTLRKRDVRALQLRELLTLVRGKIERDRASPVILAGDFNLTAFHRPTLARIVEPFRSLAERFDMRLVDVVGDAYCGKHPSTNGWGHGRLSYELTDQPDLQGCIDYMLVFIPKPVLEVFRPELDMCKVEHFRIAEDERRARKLPITNLSDHFGVDAVFTVEGLPALTVPRDVETRMELRGQEWSLMRVFLCSLLLFVVVFALGLAFLLVV